MFDLTQEELAGILKVTQQTIARWETGKAEPNLAALSDLAVILNTSVDELLGIDRFPKMIEKGYRQSVYLDHMGGFWGHLGLLYPNETKTRWYPITQDTANFIERCLRARQEEGGGDWTIVSTLNNRLLVFAMQAMKRVWLLDNNAEQPNDDWELTWDGYQGLSPEIYRALEERFFGLDEQYQAAYPAALRNILDEIVKEDGFDDEAKIAERILDTHIHFRDGTLIHYWIETQDIMNLVLDAESGASRIFRINGGEFKSYYPATSIRMIDLPLLQYRAAEKRNAKSLEEEGNAR
ncbi:DNA-binding transcriptional regulator, XRE-family HTH domain [Nitrosospira sp. Nl5]|nr:DNA-binding transcriptional regulator, XRE-family HTH domain [Nitrosospira sp. Nl5]